MQEPLRKQLVCTVIQSVTLTKHM